MESTNSYFNPHQILDGFASLRRHHEAKRKFREQQLNVISVPTGSRVIDIGCGPGLYLHYWLNLTRGHNVSFTVLDSSAAALNECKRIAGDAGVPDRVECIQLDLFSLSEIDPDSFDVVFVGYTIEYVSDPVNWLRTQVKPLLKPGGKVALRDLDCAFMNCNVVDPALNSKIVFSRIRNGQVNSRDSGIYQNAFVGRELRRYLIEAEFASVEQFPYFIEFTGPLNVEQIDYLFHLHTTWYVEDRLHILTEHEKMIWSAYFNPNSPQCILNHSSFNYVEAEYLAIATKA